MQSQKFPQESSINLPSGFRKFIPSRFWKLILYRARTRPPTLFKGYSPPELITGLSSAKIHGKIVLDEVLLSPAKSINTSNTTRVSPASYYQQLNKVPLSTEYCSPARLLEYFSPRRVIHSPSSFPNGVIFSYRHSCNYYPPAEAKSTLQTSAQE